MQPRVVCNMSMARSNFQLQWDFQPRASTYLGQYSSHDVQLLRMRMRKRLTASSGQYVLGPFWKPAWPVRTRLFAYIRIVWALIFSRALFLPARFDKRVSF